MGEGGWESEREGGRVRGRVGEGEGGWESEREGGRVRGRGERVRGRVGE